jgi:predicted SprT family Zn-dependent metalloprotease
MTREGAELLARATMLRLGLRDWDFQFDRRKRRAGACYWGRKLIKLSIHMVDRNGYDEVMETILHEIAHAIAGRDAGHGPVWQAVAIGLGAKPERYCGDHVMPKGEWRATCICGAVLHKHKKPKRILAHRGCAHILTWTRGETCSG